MGRYPQSIRPSEDEQSFNGGPETTAVCLIARTAYNAIESEHCCGFSSHLLLARRSSKSRLRGCKAFDTQHIRKVPNSPDHTIGDQIHNREDLKQARTRRFQRSHCGSDLSAPLHKRVFRCVEDLSSVKTLRLGVVGSTTLALPD